MEKPRFCEIIKQQLLVEQKNGKDIKVVDYINLEGLVESEPPEYFLAMLDKNENDHTPNLEELFSCSKSEDIDEEETKALSIVFDARRYLDDHTLKSVKIEVEDMLDPESTSATFFREGRMPKADEIYQNTKDNNKLYFEPFNLDDYRCDFPPELWAKLAEETAELEQ